MDVYFKNLFIYLFLESGEGRERGRETLVCGCLLHALYWGPDLAHNPGMYPDWELELATLWFAGWCSIH